MIQIWSIAIPLIAIISLSIILVIFIRKYSKALDDGDINTIDADYKYTLILSVIFATILISLTIVIVWGMATIKIGYNIDKDVMKRNEDSLKASAFDDYNPWKSDSTLTI